MAFGYFGAKHGMARFYPAPLYNTVIEPFAGAAGYACYWSSLPGSNINRVILIDSNPNVIALWHRLQRMSIDQLMSIPDPIKGEVTHEPLIAAASGAQGMAVLNRGVGRVVTDRMVESWPNLKRRLCRMIPIIRKWEIVRQSVLLSRITSDSSRHHYLSSIKHGN